MIACDRTVSCQRLLAGTRMALTSFVLEHLQIPNVMLTDPAWQTSHTKNRTVDSLRSLNHSVFPIAEEPSPFSFLFAADPRDPSLAGVEPFEFGVGFDHWFIRRVK